MCIGEVKKKGTPLPLVDQKTRKKWEKKKLRKFRRNEVKQTREKKGGWSLGKGCKEKVGNGSSEGSGVKLLGYLGKDFAQPRGGWVGGNVRNER